MGGIIISLINEKKRGNKMLLTDVIKDFRGQPIKMSPDKDLSLEEGLLLLLTKTKTDDSVMSFKLLQ